MPLFPIRDLEVRNDVKGGSPRTPSGGVPVREYQDYVVANGYGNGVWKTLAGAAGGLWIMSLVAWWTAFQQKGVTQKEMQDYDKEYSLFAQQRDGLTQRNQIQDGQIGALQALQQANISRLNTYETKFHDDERDITELQNKVKQFGDFIDELRKAKK